MNVANRVSVIARPDHVIVRFFMDDGSGKKSEAPVAEVVLPLIASFTLAVDVLSALPEVMGGLQTGFAALQTRLAKLTLMQPPPNLLWRDEIHARAVRREDLPLVDVRADLRVHLWRVDGVRSQRRPVLAALEAHSLEHHRLERSSAPGLNVRRVDELGGEGRGDPERLQVLSVELLVGEAQAFEIDARHGVGLRLVDEHDAAGPILVALGDAAGRALDRRPPLGGRELQRFFHEARRRAQARVERVVEQREERLAVPLAFALQVTRSRAEALQRRDVGASKGRHGGAG